MHIITATRLKCVMAKAPAMSVLSYCFKHPHTDSDMLQYKVNECMFRSLYVDILCCF